MAIFWQILEFLQKISQKSWENFWKFLTDFVEVFKILILGNNVSWKLHGNSINYGKIMNKYRSNFKYYSFGWCYDEIFITFLWNFNEICGEMQRIFVQIFKHFDGHFVLFLHQFLEKPLRNCRKNMQLLISIPEKSIDTFPITKCYNRRTFFVNNKLHRAVFEVTMLY